MIPKSLSRKSPSFSQLIAYMNSEKADERFDLHQHCFSRRDDALAREFYENSQLLSQRKNGNYLYHEILSITIEEGVDREHAKACLRELALKYMQDRCPTNMVYPSVAARGYEASSVVVAFTNDADISNGKRFAELGMQIAAGVPLFCDEREDYFSFRVGLFGLDKWGDVEGVAMRFREVLGRL